MEELRLVGFFRNPRNSAVWFLFMAVTKPDSISRLEAATTFSSFSLFRTIVLVLTSISKKAEQISFWIDSDFQAASGRVRRINFRISGASVRRAFSHSGL